MKKKIEKEFTRAELADYLQKLAEQLRSGSFESDDRNWSVPDQLTAKIKHKEKKGRIETKLKWRWSTLEDYNPEERKEVVQWQDSFKTIKKRLAATFRALDKTVRDGNLPDEKTLYAFIDDSNAMAAFAEPEGGCNPVEVQFVDAIEQTAAGKHRVVTSDLATPEHLEALSSFSSVTA